MPVRPVKREVFALDTAGKPEGPLPLTVLPSGLYFRSETGGLILLGKSMEDDAVGFDFTWDDKRFSEILWAELAAFVPAFDTLKLIRGWAGLYALNTLDGNAILGEWPELKGFYLANGFSGHGLQQGPAVGRYICERITGRTPTLSDIVYARNRVDTLRYMFDSKEHGRGYIRNLKPFGSPVHVHIGRYHQTRLVRHLGRLDTGCDVDKVTVAFLTPAGRAGKKMPVRIMSPPRMVRDAGISFRMK